MKNILKKVFVCLSIVLFSSCLLTACGDNKDQNLDDTYFNTQGLDFYLLNDNTYGVKIGNATELSSITIPESYCGKTVSTIMESGFEYSNNNLIKVIISKNIKVIEKRAFYSCVNLTTVEFLKNTKLTKIGDSAFECCYNLSGVKLPNSLIYIGDRAFLNTSIHQIIIPKNVAHIGVYAFSNNVENIEQSGFIWDFFCESSIYGEWDENWNLIYNIILYKPNGKKEEYKQIGSVYLYRSDSDITQETDYHSNFWKYENANKDIIDIWAYSDENSEWFVTYRWQIIDGIYYSLS